MTYRNFAAQAVPFLEKFARSAMSHAPSSAAFAYWLASTIREAQHFSLPEGGKLLDDKLRGLVGEEIRLPYPKITVECVSNDPSSVRPDQIFAPRRLAIAVEGGFALERLRQIMRVEGDIAIFGVSECEGMWVPDVTGVTVQHVQEPLPDGGMISVDVFVAMPEAFELTVKRYGGRREALDAVAEDLSFEVRSVCELLEALSCSNVSTQRVAQASPTVNRKRESKGKTPLLDYHVLVIDRPTPLNGTSRGPLIGERASPRQHLRRGHIRRYATGKKVWINSMLVGQQEHGVIVKDYEARV